ncbi:MAG: hypothetical protein AAF938_04555 [Myxococcota bacterium]
MSGQEIVVVREVLEGMMEPGRAHALLLSALDTLSQPPSTTDQWVRFAEGPLQETIARQIGASEASQVVARLSAIMGAMKASPPPRRRQREATAQFDRRAGPTRVLVMAAVSRLARMLKAALGPSVVAMSVEDLEGFRDVVHDLTPALFLVDLTSPATISTHDLESALNDLPAAAIVLIWDEGTPRGQRLAEKLQGHGRPVAWVDRREGVEPLLDHIRAARA